MAHGWNFSNLEAQIGSGFRSGNPEARQNSTGPEVDGHTTNFAGEIRENGARRLGLFFVYIFFDCHVLEFTGLEYLAAF